MEGRWAQKELALWQNKQKRDGTMETPLSVLRTAFISQPDI